MMIKKVMALVPSAYNKKALGDVLNFVVFYKNDLDIYILVKGLDEELVEEDGYKLIDVETSFGKYIRGTADFIIDAGSINMSNKKGNNQKYVSIWHGIPYKKMFIDKDIPEAASAAKYSLAYDVMISSSPYYTKTFLRESMCYTGEIHELGSSRMDTLFNKTEKDIATLKNELGLPLNKKIILYAPTFREEGDVNIPFNLSKFADIVKDEYVVAVKLHYLNNLNTKPNNVIDLTNYSNVSDILLCADVLISDYSSVIFDYSVLDKPIVLYQYDSEQYFKDRGVYFELDDYVSDESIVKNEEELFSIFIEDKLSKIKNTLAKEFYPYEDGNSTKRIVEKLNFDLTPRKTKDLIFLINELNEIGGIHTFVNNMAKYYKENYNTRIFVIAIREFARRNNEVHLFNTENIDFALSWQYTRGLATLILKKSTGNFVSMQFSAHRKFQKKLLSGNAALMFHGDAQLLIDADEFSFHLKYLNEQKMYNYKSLLLLSKPDVDKLRPYLNDKIKNRLTYMNNSIDLPFLEIRKSVQNDWAFIGRLDDQKNPFGLVEIGNIIKSNNSDLRINVYGDGPLKEELNNRINENDLQNIIILRGYESDKNEIFRNNNGLVMLSKYEGYPYVILEAYAYGRPVVLFDTFTAAKDMVINNKTGFLVANNDYDSLFKSMQDSNELKIEDIKEIYSRHTNDAIFNGWEKIFADFDNLDPVSRVITAKKKKKKKIKFQYKKAMFSILSWISEDFANNLKCNINRDNNIKKIQNTNKPMGVSVIIPCYNSSSTIKMPIDSVLNQGLNDVEIIVVDDGSSDIEETKRIISGINPKDGTVRLIEKEHSGLGMTRNIGINEATKEYVFFLDADDYLPSNALSSMLLYINKHDLNFVAGITQRIYKENGKKELWYPRLYQKNDILDNPDDRFDIYDDALSTNKLYKRKIFEEYGLFFENGLYEDKLFTSQLYSTVPKMGIINKVVYCWIVYGQGTSISTNKTANNFIARVNTIDKCWKYYNDFVKRKMFALFFRHDLIIYIREFKDYTDLDKKIVFEKAKEFSDNNSDNYYVRTLNNYSALYIYKTLINDDFESFKHFTDALSNEYYLNLEMKNK